MMRLEASSWGVKTQDARSTVSKTMHQSILECGPLMLRFPADSWRKTYEGQP